MVGTIQGCLRAVGSEQDKVRGQEREGRRSWGRSRSGRGRRKEGLRRGEGGEQWTWARMRVLLPCQHAIAFAIISFDT
jgi:hypothetical protein